MINDWPNRGTTLLEMLLALGLSTIVVGAMITVYLSSNNAYQKLAEYSDAQYTARSAISQIAEDIRAATATEIGPDGSELRLRTLNNDLIRYYMENNQLYRVKTSSLGTGKVPVAEKVSRICFNSNNSLVTATIEVTIAETTYHLSRTVYSRLH